MSADELDHEAVTERFAAIGPRDRAIERLDPTGRPDRIEFIDIHKSFGANKVLEGLTMGLPEGVVSMILGPSGTGKSVCIKHMVGLLTPDSGDVLVHGHSVPGMRSGELLEMRKKFGLLFQDGAL